MKRPAEAGPCDWIPDYGLGDDIAIYIFRDVI